MRTVVRGALRFAVLALAVGGVGLLTAASVSAKKHSCTYTKVAVPYCIATHRGRIDCSGRTWRVEKICR